MMWAMMVFIIFIIPYKSLWSSDEIYFYRNWTNWLLIAICNGNLWISWTCWIVYTIVTICPALSKILCFNMLQTSSKVTSTWKKVIEVSALNPNATHSQPNDPTLFLLIRKLIIINSCFQVEACCELKLAITFLPKIIWMVTNTEPCIRVNSCILYWSLHL